MMAQLHLFEHALQRGIQILGEDRERQPMTVISSPLYRWRVGEVEITRVLEFEAALFEPSVLYPAASPEIVNRHRPWLEPKLMHPASGLLVFAFHSTVIKTPHATILVDVWAERCSAIRAIMQPWRRR